MRLTLLIGLMLLSFACFSTHIRSAEIIVERVNCTSLTYKIRVIAYLNTASMTPFGGDNNRFEDGGVDFGDGLFVTIPSQAATPRPDLGPGIGTAEFETTHTYARVGAYKISYFERDRNSSILNISNP